MSDTTVVEVNGVKLEVDLRTANRNNDLVLRSYNSKSEDFEIIADNNDNSLEQNRDSVMRTLTRNIERAQVVLNDAIEKKKFFEEQFGALCPIQEE